jgi:cyclomaltodextrinase
MVRSFVPQTFVGNHDVTRLASRLADPRHLPLALALLFALPGVPTVYYGDEFGLRGVKEDRAGGDDAVRPRLPADAAPPDAEAAALADLHRLLIGVRRRHPWLVDAVVEEPDVLTNELLAVRLTSGEDTLAVVLNVGDTPADVRLPMPGAVVAGTATVRDGAVQLPPHAFALVTAGG